MVLLRPTDSAKRGFVSQPSRTGRGLVTGTVIFSLDCEGKWGVADHLTREHHALLDDANLRATYRKVCDVFARFGVPATFASVALFATSDEEFAALPLEDIARELPYAAPALDDLRNGSGQGWRAPWYRDMVGDLHELASHGGTHTPFDDLTPEQAHFELSLIPGLAGQTFIFPRNRVDHLSRLAEAGVIAYREAPRRGSRLASLAAEFNIRERSQDPRDSTSGADEPEAIPAGYFINWLSHLRRVVPRAVTRLRARSIIEHAARTGGVAHFWTHPENIATAPATLDNLVAIVEETVRLRDRGEIVVQTQEAFARSA